MAEINTELFCVCMCVCLCAHLFACMNLPRNETRKWAIQTTVLLVVIDDASMAYFRENQWHINAGQCRQDVLTGYVMGMTIKGPFCCLWILLRCLQSWLRFQAFSTGHVTHACFFFFFRLIDIHNYCFCSVMCNCDLLGCDTV